MGIGLIRNVLSIYDPADLVSLMSILSSTQNRGTSTPGLDQHPSRAQSLNTIHAVVVMYRNEKDATDAPDASFCSPSLCSRVKTMLIFHSPPPFCCFVAVARTLRCQIIPIFQLAALEGAGSAALGAGFSLVAPWSFFCCRRRSSAATMSGLNLVSRTVARCQTGRV